MLLGFISFPLVGSAIFFLFFAGERANHFALGIQKFQLNVLFGFFLQVVEERRAFGRIFSDGVAAAPGMAHARSNGGMRSEQMRVFGGDGGARLAQRADVIEHPECAAMRGNDQIVLVDDEVVDGSGRQVELQGLPVRTIIEGNPRASFGAGIEQALVLGIFANSVNVRAVGKAGGDGRPSFAEISGLVNVGLKVIELVSVDGGVSSAGFERGRFDQADHGPFGKAFGSDVGPIFSIVARELDQAIVGADPEQTFLFRRFGDSENQVVKFDAGLVFGDGAAGILLLGFVVAGQVRTDGFPGMAAVFRTEEELGGVIESVWIMGRKNAGHGPGVAVFLHGSVVAVGIERPLLDVLHLVGAAVEAGNVAEVGAGINDVRIARGNGNVAAFASAHSLPVRAVDVSAVAGSGNTNGGIVLLRAIDAVRKIVVRGHMIELRGGLIPLRGPILAAIDGNGCAAVIAVDKAIGIVRINPQAVVIAVRGIEAFEGFAAVVRTE